MKNKYITLKKKTTSEEKNWGGGKKEDIHDFCSTVQTNFYSTPPPIYQ